MGALTTGRYIAAVTPPLVYHRGVHVEYRWGHAARWSDFKGLFFLEAIKSQGDIFAHFYEDLKLK